MLSLYDYLGKAAGLELGKEVAEYAKHKKAKYSKSHVSNPKYTGEVMRYTREFLDDFFLGEDHTEINTALSEDSFKE